MKRTLFPVLLSALTTLSLALGTSAADKKLVLIAGKPSHPPGMHEFRAGSLLLQQCLAGVPGVQMMVYSNGWPESASAFDGADAVVIYADGGGGHPAVQGERLKILQGLIDKGVSLGMMHYACEVQADKGGKEFIDWIGGHYEHQYSCNPMWTPEYTTFPDHPATRGVKAFSILDEWYFNIRFRPDMKGITPLLVATPSEKVRNGPYVWPAGPYKHIQEAKGRPETMMWAVEQPSGARCFGFTGGHYHNNWGDENFRKIVLNALLWAAKADVPKDGVVSAVSGEQLQQNFDPKGKK